MSKFSKDFELKLAKIIIEKPQFGLKIKSILKPSYIDDAQARLSIEVFYDYYDKYNEFLSKGLLVDYAKSYFKDEIKFTAVKDFITIFDTIDDKNYKFVENQIFTFCQVQNIISAVKENAKYLREGSVSEFKYHIDKAMNLTYSDDLGLDVEKDILERYSLPPRAFIPTGLGVIDEYIGGGLGKKELAILMGGTGVGKSMVASKIAVNAFEQGFKVIYYTMEMEASKISIRLDSAITSIPLNELIKNGAQSAEVVKQKYKEFQQKGGKILVKEFQTKSATFDDLVSHFEVVRNSYFKPDLIIVDYPAILKLPNKRDKRVELGEINERMRGFAQKYDVAVLSLSQINRKGYKSDSVGLESTSESFEQNFIADLVVTLKRDHQMIEDNNAIFNLAKNRNGESGVYFSSIFNPSEVDIRILSRVGKDIDNDGLNTLINQIRVGKVKEKYQVNKKEGKKEEKGKKIVIDEAGEIEVIQTDTEIITSFGEVIPLEGDEDELELHVLYGKIEKEYKKYKQQEEEKENNKKEEKKQKEEEFIKTMERKIKTFQYDKELKEEDDIILEQESKKEVQEEVSFEHKVEKNERKLEDEEVELEEDSGLYKDDRLEEKQRGSPFKEKEAWFKRLKIEY